MMYESYHCERRVLQIIKLETTVVHSVHPAPHMCSTTGPTDLRSRHKKLSSPNFLCEVRRLCANVCSSSPMARSPAIKRIATACLHRHTTKVYRMLHTAFLRAYPAVQDWNTLFDVSMNGAIQVRQQQFKLCGPLQ